MCVLSMSILGKAAKPSQRAGFALVVALSMMSFVLLLLLSLSTLVQVECAAANQRRNTLLAREHARLALLLAIGQLQQHAGHDARVSARAEILGDGNYDAAARYWTGIWDTSDPNAKPKWLISGGGAPFGNAAESLIQLVGPGSVGTDSSQYVAAPSVDVLNHRGQRSARIAWWVGDQGVKASCRAPPPQTSAGPNYLTAPATQNLEFALASSQGLEALFPAYQRHHSAAAEQLERVQSLSQLLGLEDFTPNPTNFNGEALFHALAPLSCGVLASVVPNAQGGLLRDLSLYPELLPAGFDAYLQLAEANAQQLENAANAVEQLRLHSPLHGLEQIGPLQDGQIATPVTPILSNLMLAFSIHSDTPSDPRLYLRMRFFCELWNPFTSTLRMLDGDGNPLDLELEIDGLPTLRISKSAGAAHTHAQIDLQHLLGHNADDPDSPMVITLKNDATEAWLPGRSKNWTGVDADEQAGRSPYQSVTTDSKQWNRNNRTLGGARGIDTQIDLPGNGLQRLKSNQATTLRIQLFASNAASEQRTLLCDLDGITYERVTTTPRSATSKSANFGYHIILRGPHLSRDAPDAFRGLWLKHHDHRNPQPPFYPAWNLDFDPQAQTGSAYIPVKDGLAALPTPLPEEIHGGNVNGTIHFPIFRRLWDRSIPHLHKLWQDAPLFELPRQRPLALASLQHLYFHNERPFQVGNSWGAAGASNTLAWFDHYYFSAFSRNDDPASYDRARPLPNPRLTAYDFSAPAASLAHWQSTAASDPIAARLPATQLMVANRFNLNSTSVAAWKAVLGSLRVHGWSYLDYPDNTADLTNLGTQPATQARFFSRFSHSQAETYRTSPTPPTVDAEMVAPAAFYRRGTRHFDAEQIDALARQIVQRLKARAAPFLSIEDFLSAAPGGGGSLIEQAIATVFTRNGRQQWDHAWETKHTRGDPAELIDIDYLSPGFLTQADIMTAIGPMLSPRSDTFKIRARGLCLSPAGEALASATLEATLQRCPTPVNPTAGSGPTARTFKQLATRWLSAAEL
jgi:hypothetical protein